MGLAALSTSNEVVQPAHLTVFLVLRKTWLMHSIGTLTNGPSVSMVSSRQQVYSVLQELYLCLLGLHHSQLIWAAFKGTLSEPIDLSNFQKISTVETREYLVNQRHTKRLWLTNRIDTRSRSKVLSISCWSNLRHIAQTIRSCRLSKHDEHSPKDHKLKTSLVKMFCNRLGG